MMRVKRQELQVNKIFMLLKLRKGAQKKSIIMKL